MSEQSIESAQEKAEFPRQQQSAGGAESAWTVEARCMLPAPKEIGSQLLDQRWRQLKFAPGHGFGVPDGPRWLFEGRQFGFYSYPSAQALRWWFVANAYASIEDNGLETRLVRHEIKYSRTATAVEAAEQFDQFSSRGR